MLDWQNRGVNFNGEMLNHLRFADDIILMKDTLKETEEKPKELCAASKNYGQKHAAAFIQE